MTGLCIPCECARRVMPVLPEGVSAEAGAVMEPLCTGFKAVRMAGSILGLNVVVLGAGTVGLGTYGRQSRRRGRDRVVKMSKARIEKKAQECGADVIINPQRMRPGCRHQGTHRGSSADVSFECIGNR